LIGGLIPPIGDCYKINTCVTIVLFLYKQFLLFQLSLFGSVGRTSDCMCSGTGSTPTGAPMGLRMGFLRKRAVSCRGRELAKPNYTGLLSHVGIPMSMAMLLVVACRLWGGWTTRQHKGFDTVSYCSCCCHCFAFGAGQVGGCVHHQSAVYTRRHPTSTRS
jgi:hypothetical protein